MQAHNSPAQALCGKFPFKSVIVSGTCRVRNCSVQRSSESAIACSCFIQEETALTSLQINLWRIKRRELELHDCTLLDSGWLHPWATGALTGVPEGLLQLQNDHCLVAHFVQSWT